MMWGTKRFMVHVCLNSVLLSMVMFPMRFLLTRLLLLFLLGFGFPQSPLLAESGEGTASAPRALVDQMHKEMAKVMATATPSNIESVRGTMKSRFRGHFDLDTFARMAFKRYYKKLTKAQRKTYHAVLQELVEHTYLKRLKPGTAYWMKNRGDQVIEKRAKISITVGSKETEFDVDYLLQKGTDDAWTIYDIWIDDVSMVKTYRSQFYKVFKKHGFGGQDGLIEHMKRRI
jgi:phospholipid transport system substrate-binding protein